MGLWDNLTEFMKQPAVLGLSVGLLILLVLLVVFVVYYWKADKFGEDKPRVYSGPAANAV